MNKHAILDAFDLSTRRKRREATSFIVDIIFRIYSAEEDYMNRIPDNLQSGDAFANAEETLVSLDEAASILSDAFG
jgi:predicted restriction endonuclease